MTAIDTSKLKEGMRVEYELQGRSYHDTIKRKFDWWLSKQNDHTILTPDGSLALGITNVRFPDLQELDRVEAWEPKPGDVIRWNNFGNIIEAPLLFKWKQWFIVDLNGSPLSIHADQVAPKVKNIDERLEEILGEFETSTTSMTMQEAISQIKSLLAAKGQNVTRGEFEKKMRELGEHELCLQAAWLTFQHFTKNETK